VLSAFLERERIYFTEHFRAMLEDKARNNLGRAIGGLWD
jgi:predicted metal-dependent HD superfamily phosphohydrolase